MVFLHRSSLPNRGRGNMLPRRGGGQMLPWRGRGEMLPRRYPSTYPNP